jgi:hypothetical protein
VALAKDKDVAAWRHAFHPEQTFPEAVFLVVFDSSMNEL